MMIVFSWLRIVMFDLTALCTVSFINRPPQWELIFIITPTSLKLPVSFQVMYLWCVAELHSAVVRLSRSVSADVDVGFHRFVYLKYPCVSSCFLCPDEDLLQSKLVIPCSKRRFLCCRGASVFRHFLWTLYGYNLELNGVQQHWWLLLVEKMFVQSNSKGFFYYFKRAHRKHFSNVFVRPFPDGCVK